MATTTQQDKAFISELISSTLLEEAISWIQDNMSPEEVFKESQLKDCADRAGMVDGGEQ